MCASGLQLSGAAGQQVLRSVLRGFCGQAIDRVQLPACGVCCGRDGECGEISGRVSRIYGTVVDRCRLAEDFPAPPQNKIDHPAAVGGSEGQTPLGWAGDGAGVDFEVVERDGDATGRLGISAPKLKGDSSRCPEIFSLECA